MKTPASLRRIEHQMATVEPGSLRYEGLTAARDFKASWIALGRVLFQISNHRSYKEWRYLTFDAYCVKEIGIQPLTAKKLLRSYLFLERHEPAVLETEATPGLPPTNYPTYEAVDVLRQAKETARLPEPAYRELRERVFERGEEAPALRKQLRVVIQRAQPPEAREASEERAQRALLRRLVGTLRTVQRVAAAARLLSASLQRDLQRLIDQLDAAAQDEQEEQE